MWGLRDLGGWVGRGVSYGWVLSGRFGGVRMGKRVGGLVACELEGGRVWCKSKGLEVNIPVRPNCGVHLAQGAPNLMQKGKDGKPSLPLQTVIDHVTDELQKRTLGVLKHKRKGSVSGERGRIGFVRARPVVHGASVHLDGDRHEAVEVDNVLEAVSGDVIVKGLELKR